ncbi:MAG: iron-sulfur cluster assembly accessory protein [Acidobacteria bacterium]|nr:iron-sulfur cluster assembly accessory protein [Acidobacteriota bacterium]
MIQLTDTAINKVTEIMTQQSPQPSALRISVVGGGCSGFQYSMAFENNKMPLDKEYTFGDGLRVFVDQASLLYLDNCQVDYVETMEGAGFKFENPNVTSTCGCGSSFSA